MSSSQAETELELRLERLTGEAANCCLPEYRDLVREVRAHGGFRAQLARARALADEGRLTVIALLARRSEMCACEIQAALGLTHATVSHHMSVLEEAGLVQSERRGKWVYYRLGRRPGVTVP